MDIIVRGEPHELDFVRRICRDKVARGVLAILPDTGPASDEVVRLRKERDETKAVITTLQEHVNAIEQERKSMCNAQHELAELLGLVLSIAVQHGAEIPDDIIDRMSKYGVEIPAIEESVTEPDETAPESNESEPMDNKYIEIEDMQEVDLDTDDKTPASDDTKDVQTDDVKETAPAKKKSKRSKKSK